MDFFPVWQKSSENEVALVGCSITNSKWRVLEAPRICVDFAAFLFLKNRDYYANLLKQ